MKATLEFNLPEEEYDHKYALSGLDALLAIDDVLTEIRSALKYNSGALTYVADDNGIMLKPACMDTLERVRDFIYDMKEKRNLPELI